MSGTSDSRSPAARALAAFADALAGWPFAATSLAALVTAGAGTVALLAWPAGAGPMAAFAEEFRRWCFGREVTGVEPGALALAISSPVVLSLLVLGLWGGPLRRAARATPGRVLAAAGVTAAIVALSGLALFATQRSDAAAGSAELAFPGERIRTAVPAPAFQLADQRGAPVSLESLRGRVVLVTAIYARCSTACPMILAETRSLVASLDDHERAEVTLRGITLDPEHDTQERLAEVAQGYRLDGDLRLLTGPAEDVERTLDRFGFERRRDPETGRIDHASLFVLVDRDGRIAYRLAAGASQPQWLRDAVRSLVAEAPPRAAK